MLTSFDHIKSGTILKWVDPYQSNLWVTFMVLAKSSFSNLKILTLQKSNDLWGPPINKISYWIFKGKFTDPSNYKVICP